MRRLAPVPALLVALLALSACSGSDKADVPPSTTNSTTGSSTSTSATTATTAPPVTTTTGATTSTTVKPGSVFTSFTISPPSPVECNAPTMIELKWTARGVKSVTLTIDGIHAGTFGGGAQDHLQYFACDGKKHTYTLNAKVGTTTETVSRDVVSNALN